MAFDGVFHHIGLACRDMDEELQALAAIGYAPETGAIEDPIQKVAVRFLTSGGPRIELVSPLGEDSPIKNYLKRDTRLYHLTYEVRDFGGALRSLEEVVQQKIVRTA